MKWSDFETKLDQIFVQNKPATQMKPSLYSCVENFLEAEMPRFVWHRATSCKRSTSVSEVTMEYYGLFSTLIINVKLNSSEIAKRDYPLNTTVSEDEKIQEEESPKGKTSKRTTTTKKATTASLKSKKEVVYDISYSYKRAAWLSFVGWTTLIVVILIVALLIVEQCCKKVMTTEGVTVSLPSEECIKEQKVNIRIRL